VDAEIPAAPAKTRNSAEAAASDFVSPDVTPPIVISSFVEQALKADPIQVDVKNDAEFNTFDPAQLATPALVLFGSDDPGLAIEEAGKMFAAIAARDKQMVVLPGADHAAQLEDTHDAWIAAIVNFVNRPPVRR
jgi:pimeloyl-ACP methyl ester carboxylesterase